MVISVVAKDLIQQVISCREVDGVIVELRTQMMVEGLEARDPNALWQALNNINVPIQNDPPPKFDGDDKFPHLVLTERIPALVESSPTKARIDLVYTGVGGEGQKLQRGGTIGSGSATLEQITTERFDDVERDESGNVTGSTDTQITVEHTFSDGTAGFADDVGTIPEDKHGRQGKKIIQTGEISVLSPTFTLNIGGLINTETPISFSQQWIGKVNFFAWGPYGPREWLIMSAGFELHGEASLDASRELKTWYRFNFTFGRKQGGWDPSVVFIDSKEGGKPPRGLLPDKGFKTIEWYDAVNFNDLFPHPEDTKAISE